MNMPILIIGAGLSGLTTARLLTNSGIPNIVFEASPPDRSQGFSISLRDWGYEVLLEALGGLPLSSLTRGVAPDRHVGGHGWVDLVMRDSRTGEVLVAPDPATQPSIVRANRNALRAWIADCGDDELDIRYGHRLQSVQGTIGDMTAVFENGSRYRGSLVVAADGVHSTVRSKILPHIVPEVVPAVVYHGEFQLPRVEFERLIRPLAGASNVLAGVGDGFNTPITICNLTPTLAHLDWSYSRPARGDDDPLYRPNSTGEEAKQIPQALLDELATCSLAEPWAQILSAEAIRQHSVFHWTSRYVSMARSDADAAAERGVVFVGDSWHAMPIFGGEGGNHALVDGVELAAALRDGLSHLDKAVAAYYDGAWRRCHDAVRRSKGRFYVLHRPIAEWRELAEKKVSMSSSRSTSVPVPV
ncbi:FAD-dependent monooxygenase [Hypoxylon rubiginosum]|uniref:FAD-dependent monooxygenase n=1 Tax=Hypoxylon rubiginosum TaxID=110542 RepID=A0ACB9YRC0_9PEZI|nr:FAD-dependent monooxygenase [Hypoxylon rubiginosum]